MIVQLFSRPQNYKNFKIFVTFTAYFIAQNARNRYFFRIFKKFMLQTAIERDINYNLPIFVKNIGAMKIRISTIIFVCMLCLACRKHVEPQYITGYITTINDTEIILEVPDSISSKQVFAIDENTMRDEGAYYEGNIAEVEYMPATEEGERPLALDITTDPTYPRMLGRWHTDKDDKLQIDIILQAHGKVLQVAPTEILQFTRWQLTGVEDEITLHGTLSLPPIKNPEEKKNKKDNDELESAPSRRTMNFCATARLTDDDEGNTEQHKVLIITTDNGRKSKLYPAGQ